MDTTQIDPRWQGALAHSRYLSNLLQARPALIPELAASWLQPLDEALLTAPLAQDFADDETLKSALRRLRHALGHLAVLRGMAEWPGLGMRSQRSRERGRPADAGSLLA